MNMGPGPGKPGVRDESFTPEKSKIALCSIKTVVKSHPSLGAAFPGFSVFEILRRGIAKVKIKARDIAGSKT